MRREYEEERKRNVYMEPLENDEEEQERAERVIILVRDHIIHNNVPIKDVFSIEDMSSDIWIDGFTFKKMLKDVCGAHATFTDLECAIRHIQSEGRKLDEEKRANDYFAGGAMDQEIAQRKAPENEVEFVNFRHFEALLRKFMKKSGYKPATRKRGRDELAEMEFEIEEAYMSVAYNRDLKHYIKCFIQYYETKKAEDELNDLAEKI